MNERDAPICINCVHRIRPEQGLFYKCAAFPEGIPQEIVDNVLDHHKPIDGDNGIRYQAVIEGWVMPDFGPKKMPDIPAGGALDV